jgi:hypothetical protein
MGYEELWCPDLESNQGHKDFQSFALPTELSGPYNTSDACAGGAY